MSADASDSFSDIQIPIVLGPDAIEGEPVGFLNLSGKTIGSVLLKAALPVLIKESGLLPRKFTAAERQQSITTLLQLIKELSPSFVSRWFTSLVQWEVAARSLTSEEEFLNWLAVESPYVHLVIGVPEVQNRIHRVRTNGTAKQRARLGDIIAGRSSGRPSALPDARTLYHEVGQAEDFLKLVWELRSSAPNLESAWTQLKQQNPNQTQAVETLGLKDRWFGPQGFKSKRLAKLSPYRMACEFVAQSRKISADTVEKRVGRIRRQRNPKRFS